MPDNRFRDGDFNVLWEAKDKRASVIQFTKGSLNHLIDHNHSEMTNLQKEITETVSSPDNMYLSNRFPNRMIYEKQSLDYKHGAYRVVVQYDNSSCTYGIVTTAYPIPKEDVLKNANKDYNTL